jgi:xanthine dehydrogenase YagS FAD-binding subunit
MHPFEYHRAGSVAEALRLSVELSESGEVLYLAGGTTLYDLMKLGVATPAAVVDVRRVPELAYLRLTETELIIGAGARMSDVAADPMVREAFPMLSESLWRAASAQIRNMATIGGNLLQRTRCSYFRGLYPCNKRDPGSGCSALGGIDENQAVLGGSEHCVAVYPGDLAVALVALGAVLDVLGPEGARTLPVADLHRLPGATPDQEHTLAPGELITAVRVPVLPVARTSTYLKLRPRESYAFAWASAAVAVSLGEGGVVDECRIALGGLATRPWRAFEAESWLEKRILDAGTARQAGELALRDARPGQHNEFKVELGVRAVAEGLLTAGDLHA